MATTQVESELFKMKKLIAFLFMAGTVYAQNPSGIQFLPGSCQTTLNKTCTLYRMPDTTNAYKTDVTDGYGIYDFRIWEPGVYWRKIQVGTTVFWTDKSSYTPIVPIGGDSTSNAGRLIQQALDSLPATGGIIHLPPGIHLIDSNAITVNKNYLVVEGVGDNCILKLKSNTAINAFTFSANTHDVTFRNIRFNGNKDSLTGNGAAFNINGSGIRNLRFENIHFSNILRNCFTLANGVTDVDIVNCRADSTGRNASSAVDDSGAFVYAVTNVSDIRIKDNVITDWSGTGAVRVVGSCSNFKISRNLFRGHSGGAGNRRGIFIDSAAGSVAPTEMNITDNRFSNIDENAVFLNFVNNSLISENQVDTAGNNGFELNGDNLTISKNIARWCTAVGIITNNAQAGTVTDNKCILNGTRGIYIYGSQLGSGLADSTKGLVVNNNLCVDNSTASAGSNPGIEIGTASGADNAHDGWARNIVVNGNVCYDTRAAGSKTQGWGLKVVNNVNHFIITSNMFLENSTAGRTLGGTRIGADSVVANNIP